MSCVVRFACGKTSTENRADAVVTHYLWEAALERGVALSNRHAQCAELCSLIVARLLFFFYPETWNCIRTEKINKPVPAFDNIDPFVIDVKKQSAAVVGRFAGTRVRTSHSSFLCHLCGWTRVHTSHFSFLYLCIPGGI